jgi:predicted nuclease with TOPRIM domain
MIEKQTKKKLKKIETEMKQLRKQIKGVEIRSCKSNEELTKKEGDLKTLKKKLVDLERERDRSLIENGI